jgi:DmsE family decaheme c-type cytochrome
MRRHSIPVPPVVVAVCLLALIVGALRAAPQSAPAAPSTPAAAPAAARTYVGSAACAQCHAAVSETFAVTEMGRVLLYAPRNATEKLGCESCHGPGIEHVQGPAPGTILSFGPKWVAPVKQMNEACRQCHTNGGELFWDGSVHQRRGVACVKCHTVMHQVSEKWVLSRPTESELCGQCHPRRKAQLLRSSHMPQREGKVTCGDCHNPHGSPVRRLVRGQSINDLCYRCHPDRRGPFLWEHSPVRENCLSCHEAHGSINDKLLKIKRERLCQTCHITNRHPTQPHGPLTRFAINRSCQNCHAVIHGSNHPAGQDFLR